MLAYNRLYYSTHREQARVRREARRETRGSEAISAEARAGYLAHRAKRLAQKRAYYQANKAVIAEKGRVYRRANAEIIRARARAYNAATSKARESKRKAYHQSSYLKRKYGITPDQYSEMLRNQAGRCRICRTDKPKGNGKTRFIVDHCHETGAIRGLLCHPCNAGIGLLRDDPALLERARRYLRGELDLLEIADIAC